MLLMTLQYGGTEYPWNSAKSSGSSVDQALRYIDIFHNLGVLCGIQRYGPRLSCPPSSGLVQLHLCGLLHWLSNNLHILHAYIFPSRKRSFSLLSGVYRLPSILGQMITAALSGVIGKFGSRCY